MIQFSVIIPTYNRAAVLPVTIQSVQQQTCNNFEIIIVDNGSTDNTSDVVKKLSRDDKRIKYIWQENSGSPAGSRNTGIKNAVGEWIAFLDSDDLWFENKLEEVNKVIELHCTNEEIIGISHWEEERHAGKKVKILKHGTKSKKNLYDNLLFYGNFLSTSAMTVKKKSLLEVGLFDEREDYFTVEDYELWLRLAKIGKFYYINKCLGVFSVNDDNLSSRIEYHQDKHKNVINNHIQNLGFNGPKKTRLLKMNLSRVDYYLGRYYQVSGQHLKAREILKKSILEYPFMIKKWISLLLTYF